MQTIPMNKDFCLKLISSTRLLYIYKGKKPLKQLYTIDMTKEVKIGGRSEIGYILKFYPENKLSNSCITYTDLLRVLHSNVLETENETIHLL